MNTPQNTYRNLGVVQRFRNVSKKVMGILQGEVEKAAGLFEIASSSFQGADSGENISQAFKECEDKVQNSIEQEESEKKNGVLKEILPLFSSGRIRAARIFIRHKKSAHETDNSGIRDVLI
jgi:hypothetical protein